MSLATSLLRGKWMPFASFTKVCMKSSISKKITDFFFILFFPFLCCLALKPAASILNFLHRGEFKETNGFSPHERNSLCNKLDLHMHYSMLHCQYESIILKQFKNTSLQKVCNKKKTPKPATVCVYWWVY